MDDRRFAGIRFAKVLAAGERDVVVRAVASVGAAATSWRDAGDRTYVLLTLAALADEALLRERVRAVAPDARIDVPALAILRIAPDRERHLARLADALGGRGRPAGVVASATDGDALVVEVDVRTTPLSSIVASVDAEVGRHGRGIEPLFPLSDATLTDIAGHVLGLPDLAPSRLIEPYLEALVARESTAT
jgi:hypothetical protein